MNRTTSLKEITVGYALAGITVCLGFYFCVKVGAEHGSMFLKIFSLLAALIILNFTFTLGRQRGFAARREDGSIDFDHVARNLVMSAIVWLGVSFTFAPLLVFAVRLAR